jgi:hypothetical protein
LKGREQEKKSRYKKIERVWNGGDEERGKCV